MIKLTPEQLTALHQGSQRAEVIDDAGEPYVIIHRDVYVHLQGLAGEAEEETRQRLKTLVQQGIDSGDYQPHDRVFTELREYAAELDSQHPA